MFGWLRYVFLFLFCLTAACGEADLLYPVERNVHCPDDPSITDIQAGLALTFDDHYVDQWHAHRHIFNRYGARVTFFISRFHRLNDEQIDKLKELQADGHEIACHSVNHVKAGKYIDKHGLDAYMAEEIFPAIEAMREHGFEPKTFAFPFGIAPRRLKEELLHHFLILRGSGRITQINSIFYSWDDARYLPAASVDNKRASLARTLAAFHKAKQRELVLIVYAHRIQEEKRTTRITPKRLDDMLKAAADGGLVFYTMTELGEWAACR